MAVSSLFYRVLNPVVITLLRSPLHGLLSANTLVLEYKTRRSGRLLRTPISYHEDSSGLHTFAAATSQWWRNLAARPEITLMLRGETVQRRAAVVADDPERIAPAFATFLRAVPRDARVSGVRLDATGAPNATEVLRAATRVVHVSFAQDG